jgi:hypothetical protein
MMSRPLSHKPLTILVSVVLGGSALAPVGAAAASLNINSVRVSPPSSSFVNSFSGGLGAHTDKVWGHGEGGGANAPHPLSFSECYRRNYLRLTKLDSSMGYEFISATARHICGA